MEKILFSNSPTIFKAEMKRSQDIVKLVFEDTIPADEVLLAGFCTLNERNNNVQGKYLEYKTIYKETDEKNTVYLSTGEIYVESDVIEPQEPIIVELTEEEKAELERQNQVANVKAQIRLLKNQLAESDYIIIKCQEYAMVGKEIPEEYDLAKYNAERDAIRTRINELELQLEELNNTEIIVEKTDSEV